MRSMSKAISLRLNSLSIVSFVMRQSRSKGRHSSGGSCVLDGNGETNSHEETLICGVQYRRNNAHDVAFRGHQRAAGASRIYCGVKLNEVGQYPLPFRRAEFA